MTAGLIFDYGGTLDTGGQHWGQALWHAYERHHVPVTEAQFREAYVHAERTLGRNPIIRPDFTFRQTLEKKLQLQLECFRGVWSEKCGVRYAKVLADDLYERTVEQTSKSRKVLQALKDRGLPLVLVSNFYGNMSVVLREFGFDGLFLQVIESAVVGDSLDKDIIPAQETGCQTVWLRGEGWNPGPHKRDCPHCETIDLLDELLRMIEKKYTT